jgi:hypothetical protein
MARSELAVNLAAGQHGHNQSATAGVSVNRTAGCSSDAETRRGKTGTINCGLAMGSAEADGTGLLPW